MSEYPNLDGRQVVHRTVTQTLDVIILPLKGGAGLKSFIQNCVNVMVQLVLP